VTLTLRADPELPFLDIAWSPTALARFLSENVLAPAGRGPRLVSAAIESMRYSPGRNCVLLTALRFAGERRPFARAVVSFANGDGLGETYARHYSGGHENGTRAVLLPKYCCLVELFPADWRLPALGRAMGENGLRAQAARVLRYRPHRRCVLLRGSGADRLIAKVYAPGAGAGDAYRRQRAIGAEARARGFVVPRPLALEADRQVFVMERVPGSSLKQLLGRVGSGGEGARLARAAGGALAGFHAVSVETAESRSLDDELMRVQKPLPGVRLVAPELADRADVVLERVISAAEQTPPAGAPVLVHCDYKPSQLLFNRRQVAVVDLDRACRGDAALDVGNFLAQFRKEALLTGNGSLRRLTSPFLDEYSRRTGRAGVAERARVFEVLALVRMAVRRFRMEPAAYARDPSRSLPVVLLDEAAACLSERAA
jgi:aminoglycoside phosphotransferase (APT) family kinase protein